MSNKNRLTTTTTMMIMEGFVTNDAICTVHKLEVH